MEDEGIDREEPLYFFDSYAIVEILKENPRYAPYKNKDVIFTMFNLAEIYNSAISEYGEEKANKIYDNYKAAVVEIDDETLKEAVKFRRELKKRNVSFADCIGYIYAKRHNMKFLTGDKEFESMENVEFVK